MVRRNLAAVMVPRISTFPRLPRPDKDTSQPYGGLLPVATMLEKLGFQRLVEETVTVSRIPGVITICQFLSEMVLALYVVFSRLNHLRFVAQGDAHQGFEGGGAAASLHLLAISGLLTFGSGRKRVTASEGRTMS